MSVYVCKWQNHQGVTIGDTEHAWFQPTDGGPRQCASCHVRESPTLQAILAPVPALAPERPIVEADFGALEIRVAAQSTRREVRVKLRSGNEAVYEIIEHVAIAPFDRLNITRYGKLVATKFVTSSRAPGWYLTPGFVKADEIESLRLDGIPLFGDEAVPRG